MALGAADGIIGLRDLEYGARVGELRGGRGRVDLLMFGVDEQMSLAGASSSAAGVG
jgi:hypothetical protein